MTIAVNVTYLAQSQAPAFEMSGECGWIPTFCTCCLLFFHISWVEMERSAHGTEHSHVSSCATSTTPESVVILPADEQKAMSCVMSKENVLNCYPWLTVHNFPFSHFVSLKHILPLRFWRDLSYFKCC